MICVAALIIFGILGIFSASKRKIAKEALDCVFRRLTLRKCTTGLDRRVKAQISGKLMKKNPKLARFIFKYFELFSWAFIILFLFSIVGMGIGAYNFYEYGNCNGPDSESFCLFDPLGDNIQTCTLEGEPATEFSTPNEGPGISFGNKDAEITIIQFGCFGCPNTAKAQEEINKLMNEYVQTGKARFIFKAIPLKSHSNTNITSQASYCAAEQDINKYWNFHNGLFEIDRSNESITILAESSGYNTAELWNCINSEKHWNNINTQINQALESGVYGTPTIFINDQVLVGPRPYRAYENSIKDAEDLIIQ